MANPRRVTDQWVTDLIIAVTSAPKLDYKRAAYADLNFNELRDAEIKKLRLTNAHYSYFAAAYLVEIAEKAGLPMRMLPERKELYIYDSKCYVLIGLQQLNRLLVDVHQPLGIPSHVGVNHRFIADLVADLMNAVPVMRQRTDELSINLLNATIKIDKSGAAAFFDHSPDDGLMSVLPYAYDEVAACKSFQRYLDEVLPDAEVQNLLAEYVGYCLAPHVEWLDPQKMLIVLGVAASGKSQLYQIVRALVGSEQTTSYTLKELTEGRFERIGIENKLLNYCPDDEVSAGESMFKRLVSGEPVMAEQKNQPLREMTRYAKLMCNVNAIPRIGVGNAIFRRLLIIEFEQGAVPVEKQKPSLGYDIIQCDLPGIFNWALAGLQRLVAQKRFSACAACDRAMARHRDDVDSASMFLRDYEPCETPIWYKDIFNAYVTWATDEGIKPFSRLRFSRSLTEAGITAKRAAGNKMVVYARLKPSVDALPATSF